MASAGVDLVLVSGSTSLVTPGPIIGSSEPGMRVNQNSLLSTRDLSPGASGDVGSLPGFTIEFWMRVFGYPAGPQSLVVGPNARVALPNRQYASFLNSNGTVTFVWTNTANTTFTLTSFAAVQWGGWRHIVFTYGNNVQRIYIDGVQDNSQAASQVADPDLIAGSADMYVSVGATDIPIDFAELAVYRSELSAARVLAHYQAGAQRGYGAQTTSNRVNAVLDTAGSTAARTVQTGVRSITPRYMTGQSPLDAIREAVAAEAIDAAFFVTRNGALVFLAANHRSSAPYNTVQQIFGDAGGTEIPYLDLGLDYSDSFIANYWTVTREGSSLDPGQTMTVSDSSSIAVNLKRPQSLTGLPILADSDSSTIAAAMLAKYKDPMERVTSVAFSTLDPTVAAAVLQRELMDKITVKRTPPGGGARISQDLWIQKITIAGTNDGNPWTITWGVSPL